MSKKVLIIGGVAGGASAAARLRRLDESAKIIVFEKGEYISFANCGLPYYIGDVIQERDRLLVQTPENMKRRFNIEVRTLSEVIRIDRENKAIEVLDKSTGNRYKEDYDCLVISTGAEPFRPKIDGIDSDRIFSLRNIPDTDKIKDFVEKMRPKKALIVGAGFIGLEVAENLYNRGLEITIVELSDHVIGPMDYDMAAFVHHHLRSKGIRLLLNSAVTRFVSEGAAIKAELSPKSEIETDMVVMGVGVRPESRLASEAGIKLGNKGGILVNEHMQTSDPDIYAVGDVAEVRDFIHGGTVLVPLAGPANKQGRIAADNICGRSSVYKGTQGTSIVKVFDLVAALTGSNEKQLDERGIEYYKSITHSPSHAGYYPGAQTMSIKLLFAKADGRILGAQIVGYDGTDKRIDVLAAAIRAGMSVFDLEELELAYAPPFSSAKDPVNIAGYAASNIMKGDTRVYHWNEVQYLDRSTVHLVDVRTKMEFSLGTIEGAVNIPVDELRDRLTELQDGKDVYLFCQAGLRGYIAERMLIQHGFNNVRNLSGGYLVYSMAMQSQSSEGITSSSDDKCEVLECGKPRVYRIDVSDQKQNEAMERLEEYIKKLDNGDLLEITSAMPEFNDVVGKWSERAGCCLEKMVNEGQLYKATIRKGNANDIKSVSKKGDL
jgi:NADPH-dependent 2,4-dienoyl-CoA reductase/sulfur reductase-like enzyme/rhodanese-related sulfurtransferase/TusA-related sulfurtransferase